MPPRTEQKYRLSKAQLQSLTMGHRPTLTVDGWVHLVDNTTGRPYRFRDGSPGSPIGFGSRAGPDSRTRAGRGRSHIRQTGEDPQERIKATTEARKVRGTTVGEALQKYLDSLKKPPTGKKAKPGSIRCRAASGSAVVAPGRRLIDVAVADLTDERLVEALNNMRHTAMQASNLLSKDTKDRLKAAGRRWELRPGRCWPTCAWMLACTTRQRA